MPDVLIYYSFSESLHGAQRINTKFCVLLHIKLVNRLKRKEFLDVFNSDQNCFDSNNQDISHDLKASTANLQCLKNCIPRP